MIPSHIRYLLAATAGAWLVVLAPWLASWFGIRLDIFTVAGLIVVAAAIAIVRLEVPAHVTDQRRHPMTPETPRTLREAAEILSRRLERLYHDRIDLEFPWEQEWKALRAALASTEEAPLDGGYEQQVARVAIAIHETCLNEWRAIAIVDPLRQVTQHLPDAHYGMAHDLVRRLWPHLAAAYRRTSPTSGEAEE